MQFVKSGEIDVARTARLGSVDTVSAWHRPVFSFRVKWQLASVLVACLAASLSGAAVAARVSDEAWRMEAEAIVSSLEYTEGKVRIHGTNATIEVPWNFSFLGKKDAERVLVRIWGNPPGTGVLGLLVPRGTDFMRSDSWAVVVQYLSDGYVEAEGFASIDFDQLLLEMQQATRLASLERERAGYAGLELVDWASRPEADSEKNVIYWAKEYANPADDTRTLNYNVRLLGRAGVLVLTAVAPMDVFEEVSRGMTDLLEAVRFVNEWQYADVNRAQDLAAPYNLAGLISENLEPQERDLDWLSDWALYAVVFVGVLLIILFRLRRASV